MKVGHPPVYGYSWCELLLLLLWWWWFVLVIQRSTRHQRKTDGGGSTPTTPRSYPAPNPSHFAHTADGVVLLMCCIE